MSTSHQDIAVAHEHYPERGGGEHVADELARTFDAPVVTGYANDHAVADDVEVRPLATGAKKRLFDRDSVWAQFARDAWYMFAWEDAPLGEFDTVVMSGNNPGWYVPRDDQTVVRYVHSPPRTAFDRFHEIGTASPLSRLYSKATRQLYQAPANYATLYVANSELVAQRLQKYWNIPDDDIRVVYPPVDVGSYGPPHAHTRKEYYFTFSRLHPAKRIDEIVQAFNGHGDKRLVVGGDGPERERLEQMAGDNVEFVGFLSEAEKRRRLAECKAFVFAAENEDFGIVPIEAMASGTPVIGVADGYTRYQVREGENGILFNRGVLQLRSAIREFEDGGVAWSADRIQAFVEQYSTENFREEMRAAVEEARERDRIVVEDPTSMSETKSERIVADGGEEA